jgi:hypothetical protein
MKKIIRTIMIIVWVAIMIGCAQSTENTNTSVEEKESTAFDVVRSIPIEDDTQIGQVSNREVLVNSNYFDKPVSKTVIPTYSVKTFMYKKNNIDYRVFMMGNGSEEAGIFVMNETKEQLEIELLKLQIKELKPIESDYSFD